MTLMIVLIIICNAFSRHYQKQSISEYHSGTQAKSRAHFGEFGGEIQLSLLYTLVFWAIEEKWRSLAKVSKFSFIF